jgi:F-type H+-transporting ATPase subunit a
MRETTFWIKDIVIAGRKFSYHADTLIFSLLVSLAVFLVCLLLTRRMQYIPSKRQALLESIVEWFDDVLKESLGPQGRRFLSFIVTLFLFILVSNWSAVIPGFLSPTRDINTCLGLGLLVLIIAHTNAIRTKGLGRYLKSYFKPYWWLFPSNVFAEVSKTLSHSFRLFGNIFAGGIVIALVPTIIMKLLHYWGIPLVLISNPLLKGFFGIFIGGIQALVFTILAVAYMGVLAQE